MIDVEVGADVGQGESRERAINYRHAGLSFKKDKYISAFSIWWGSARKM